MKYYLHRVTAKLEKGKKKYKINDYSIKEFDSFEKALNEYRKDFFIEGDSKQRRLLDILIDMRITTTKSKLVAKVFKHPLRTYEDLSFNQPKSKYLGMREFVETEVEYGLSHAEFVVLKSNLKKACKEYLKVMEDFNGKRDTYYISENEKA